MSNFEARPPADFQDEDATMPLVIYVLYLAGYVTGVTAAAGVILAYAGVGDRGSYLDSHYRFQIRTFWMGLLYLAVGGVLCLVLVGWIVLAWWLVWSLVRIIKGMVRLSNRQPIAAPYSWGFGD